MIYVSTATILGKERVVVALPLEMVPEFNLESPPASTYEAPDTVQIGWIREEGAFRAPTAEEIHQLSVPFRVTEYQAKAALLQTPHNSGKDCYTVVEEFMATPAAPAQIVLAWKTCRDYERTDSKIYLITRNVLQIPEAELETWLDNMFIKAKAIT